MEKPLRFLPGFRASCITVSVVYILLVLMLFAKGLMTAMGEYMVPAEQLSSPHYEDAILWVYVHMFVLALLIGGIGILVKEAKAQLWLSRLIAIVHLVYFYLDLRSSDSSLGNALYKGPASMAPVFICMFVLLLFGHLSFGKAR